MWLCVLTLWWSLENKMCKGKGEGQKGNMGQGARQNSAAQRRYERLNTRSKHGFGPISMTYR